MDYRKLGRTDINVSSCCLGTMMYGDQISETDAFEQMDYAFERGVNFYDTAEMYTVPPKAETQGESERIVGRWMKTKPREKIILASKVAGRSNFEWLREAGQTARHTKAQIDMAVERSLKNLETDYMDLYQLHWPDRKINTFAPRPYAASTLEDAEPLAEILEHLNSHVKAGRIRHVGLSNETPWGTMSFLKHAEAGGGPRMVSIQNAYSLVNRTFEEGLAEIAIHEDVGLLSYSPLAQGYLSGKYRDGALPDGSRKKMFERLGRYEAPWKLDAIYQYVDMAEGFGVDPCQFALKFCDTRPFMTSTIMGASTMPQLENNLDGFDLDWTDEYETAVNALHERRPNPCP